MGHEQAAHVLQFDALIRYIWHTLPWKSMSVRMAGTWLSTA